MTSRVASRLLSSSSRGLPVFRGTQSVFQRNFSDEAKGKKVAVVGGAGGIGQPLSLLLSTSSRVSQLNVYDLAPMTPGVAADLSHIDCSVKVKGFTGADQLKPALQDCDMIVVPAGVPRKPGMTRDDLFNINASIVQGVARAVAECCPKAFMLIISNPVNSTVPIIARTLQNMGCYDSKRLFGVTTLDVVRANAFVAENRGVSTDGINVPVIGGHAGTTILPLLSQVSSNFSIEDKEKLTQRIMFGGDEVVKAKAGGGSATLSMAYAGAKFAEMVLQASAGDKVTACSYVDMEGCSFSPTQFFSTPLTIGPNGVEDRTDFTGMMDDFEKQKYSEMTSDLEAQIKKGIDYANANK